MSVIVSNDIVVVSSGVVSSGLTADTKGEIDVLDGGTLTDSLATNGGWIVVDNGGTVQKVSATAGGDVFVDGNASELMAENGGMFDINEGTLDTGLVKSGGMGAIYADATADKVTVLDGGKFLNYGGTVQNTVVSSGGSFTVQIATAETSGTTVLTGGVMRITAEKPGESYAGKATDTTVNGGFLEVDSGTAAKTVVSAGSMRVNKSNTVDGVTLLGGKLEINDATANATVVTGGTVLVYSSGNVSDTNMTDGLFELFSGTAAKTVISGGAMRVNMSNTITDTTLNNGELTISAASANTTLMNGGVMQAVSGCTLSGTTVNVGLFTMDKGTIADTTIQGGTASFTGAAVTNIVIGSGGTVTVDSKSTFGGLADFTSGATISIDCTINFDTALATAETAQIKGFSVAMTGENAAYTLTDEAAAKGTYLLASDAATFNSDVTFGDYTLRVNVPVIVDDILSYTLGITENNDLALVIADKPDIPPLAYANSEWTGLEDGTIVGVKAGTAQIGYDAFALLADAIAGVTVDGTVEVVGGTVSFADGYSKTITVDAGATVVGTATFDKAITVNGTVVFDTSIATETAAQFGGFSNVAGDATYILNVPEVLEGTYLLASDAASFGSNVTYGAYTLKVGETVTVDEALDYTLSITAGNELALTISAYVPPTPTTPTQTYANSEWAGLADDTIVPVTGGTAKIGYDAFALLADAIAGVTDDGKINVTGGEVSFADGYSKTITVNAGATVVGKATFDTAITVNGTIAFDTQYAADGAQFFGFNYVSGDTKYTLVDPAKVGGWTLATDAAGFDSVVMLGDVALKVGDAAVTVGDFTYQLSLIGNAGSDLSLTVANYVPPTPTEFVTKSDIDGNGVSDVLFVWTGEHGEGNYQQGYWMNGTSEWWSANAPHPSDWIPLGAHDMNNNGKADSVMFGNVWTETTGKGAYIGYYIDADDASTPEHPTWQNIGYLNNEEDVTWQNCVGNLNGEKNSIVWYAPDLYAVGIWVGVDEYPEWIHLANTFGGESWNLFGCGDFDGDGKQSVVMNYNNGQFLYSVDIDGTTKSLGTLQWTGWQLRAIGDFAGDGKDDLVLFHEETGSMVLCNDGNLDDYKSIGQLAFDDWFVVGAGDYNGDKKDDLLVRQYSTGMLGYYVSADQSQWVEMGRGVGMEWTVIA